MPRFIIIPIILCSLFSSCLLQLHAADDVLKGNQYYNQGYSAYARQDYKTALLYFKKAVEANSRDAIALNCIGSTYFQLNDTDNGIKYCVKATQINPRYAEAYYNAGRGYHLKNEYSNALKFYKEAIKLNPGYTEAKDGAKLLAEYIQKKEISAAKKAARKQESQAEAQVEEIKISRQNKPADYVKAAVKSKLNKNYGQAVKELEAALRLDSNYFEAYSRLGEVYSCQYDYNSAVKFFLKAYTLQPNYQDAYNLGLSYYNIYDIKKALLYYNKALEFEPDYIQAINKIALIDFDHARYDACLARLEKALAIDLQSKVATPFRASLYNSLGLTYFKQNNFSLAIKNFELALQVLPGLASAQIHLTLAREELAKQQNLPSAKTDNEKR